MVMNVSAEWVWIAFVAGLLVQSVISRAVIKEYKRTIETYKDLVNHFKEYHREDKETIAFWQRTTEWWKAQYVEATDATIIGPEKETRDRLN
jgi:hypothetical protein